VNQGIWHEEANSIELPIPDSLPELFKKQLERISLLDASGTEFVQEGYKILGHYIHLYEDGNSVHIFMLGFGKKGIAPYFDLIMEMAYDCYGRNMNVVIVNKGDNSVKISVDGNEIGETESISSDMVHWHDEPAYIAKKWLAFNFKTLAT